MFGEISLKRARESQKCQADLNKRHVLTAHLNGKASKLDQCLDYTSTIRKRHKTV